MTTAEVLDADSSTELDVYEPPPVPNLFSPDHELALKRMAELATSLADVIEAKKLYATISGHRHITAEGWTTLGGMLGVVPVVCWTRPNETADGYVARVEARTLDGRVVGAAESECSRAESTWRNRDPYAIRSMAQTRGDRQSTTTTARTDRRACRLRARRRRRDPERSTAGVEEPR
jgi:hypothetical protein